MQIGYEQLELRTTYSVTKTSLIKLELAESWILVLASCHPEQSTVS